MTLSIGSGARPRFARRLRFALAVPLGAALVFGSLDARAQSWSDGGGKVMRGESGGKMRGGGYGGGGGHGRGVGAAGLAGALIGLGAGLAVESARARGPREETVIEEYEERPRRKVRRPRAVEVVEEVEVDDRRPPRKRPTVEQKPKPKVAKAVPKDRPDARPALAERPRKSPRPGTPPPPVVAAPAAPPPGTPAAPSVAAADPTIVPDEVLIEVRSGLSPQAVDDLAARQRLERIESEAFSLTGTTVFRWRIPDGRSVDEVVAALNADGRVLSAQPNHIYELSQDLPGRLAATQYAAAKMSFAEAHRAATGKGVAIAVIDSGVDPAHPALKGAVVESFDPIGGVFAAHPHGTAVAGLAAGRGELASPAPGAEILAVRAFAPEQARKPGAQGTTMLIIRGLEWASGRGAKIVNMSFAGPKDAKISQFIAAGTAKGAIYVAAAGNAGPSSPPLYPAADPNVIAVTATDADDRLLPVANRGGHLAVAAPGVDVLVATPGGGFGYLSGTSMASAEVAGLLALMAEARPGLPAWQARAALTGSARDLGVAGPDPDFGAGAADAPAALAALGVETETPVAAASATSETVSATPVSATTTSASSEAPTVLDVP